MRNFILIASFLSVVSISFFVSLYGLRNSWLPGSTTFYFRQSENLSSAISFSSEWNMFDDGQLLLSKNKGNISFFLENKPHSQLILSISTRSEFLPDHKKLKIDIVANATKIGDFEFSSQMPKIKNRKFIIPKELAINSKTLKISFQSDSPLPEGENLLIMENFSLLDSDHIPKIKRRGFIDVCTQNQIRGWSAAGKQAGIVQIKVNGKVIAFVKIFYDRPDLPASGLPLKSGFTFHFPAKLQKSDKVQILFLNGKTVPGHKCDFKA